MRGEFNMNDIFVYPLQNSKEYKDIIEWAKFLHDDRKINKIWIHGICIGAATALNAFVSDEAPDYLEGLTKRFMMI